MFAYYEGYIISIHALQFFEFGSIDFSTFNFLDGFLRAYIVFVYVEYDVIDIVECVCDH